MKRMVEPSFIIRGDTNSLNCLNWKRMLVKNVGPFSKRFLKVEIIMMELTADCFNGEEGLRPKCIFDGLYR